MDKRKARKLKKLRREKVGWEEASKIISNKYRPSKTVEAVQALLKECGSDRTGVADREIDAETEKKLSEISTRYGIDCHSCGKTVSQYYEYATNKSNQISNEYAALANRDGLRSNKVFALVVVIAAFAVTAPIITNAISPLIQTNRDKSTKQNNYESVMQNVVSPKAESDSAESTQNISLDSSASKNTAQKVATNNKSAYFESLPEYQLMESKIGSYKVIYTLNNEIPCGLVRLNVSYDELSNVRYDYTEKNETSLEYGDYSLYGYSCRIKYYFDNNGILKEIDAVGPYKQGVVDFTTDDIERVGSEIEDELEVSPQIGQHEGRQYTFTKNGIRYHMDTYVSRFNGNSSNEFCLQITASN